MTPNLQKAMGISVITDRNVVLSVDDFTKHF